MTDKLLLKAKLEVARLEGQDKLAKDLKLQLVKLNQSESTHKYILILEEDLRDYINWLSVEHRRPKSTFVRSWLRRKMGKDTKYSEFLKENND